MAKHTAHRKSVHDCIARTVQIACNQRLAPLRCLVFESASCGASSLVGCTTSSTADGSQLPLSMLLNETYHATTVYSYKTIRWHNCVSNRKQSPSTIR